MAEDFKNPFGKASGTAGEDKALDWDAEIAWEDSPEYVTLQPGNYEFTVKNYDRGHYNGNPEKGKISCNTVKVTVGVDTPQGEAIATNTFYFKQSAVGFIRDFFLCVGLLKKGEAFRPDFDKAIGCKGMAKFSTREYNGKTYNNIDRWIKP
ncbi:MAG: hypothetical protein PUE51_00010 [Veillonellaceae bacterium]|nr:hypothetical protein [Veillonellaceae bacterium]